jgi:lambda family phage portal protein
MIAAFIESPLDPAAVSELFGGDVNSQQYQDWLAAKNEHVAQLRGAAVIPLQPGEKLSPFVPARPSSAYSAFVEAIERQIGTGSNLPHELVLKNFANSNYSSARAAMLEAWRFFRGRREWIGTYWHSACFELWLEEKINDGTIEAPGFYENRYAYTRCRWIGPPRGWVDPVKEAESVGIRLNNNVSTLEDECSEQGSDWEEVIAQRVVELRAMKQSGLLDLMAELKTPAPKPAEEPEEQAR